MSKEVRAIANATAAVWGVLLVTGVYGVFLYRPTAAAAYADMETLRTEVTLGLVMRTVHRWSGWLALLLPIAGLIVAAVQHGWRRATPWGLLVPLALASLFSGYLLPWDQLALWAVTVGTNMTGFEPVFGDNVRFVLLGGMEISAASIRNWLLVHVFLLPAATALVTAVGIAVARRAGTEPTAEVRVREEV
jgi:quinol-cytochrome oxidoreductase complex cytochrome b subunit